MPPPAPLFLSLPSPPPPPPLLPVHHPKAPQQALTLSPPLASSSRKLAALPACPVASPRHSDYFDPRTPPPPPPRGDGGYGGRPPNGAHDGRVFTSYSIYKGKAALSFDPRPPQFVPLDVGRGGWGWCSSSRAAACARFPRPFPDAANGCSVRVWDCSLGRTRWPRRGSCCCSSLPLSPHASMTGRASRYECSNWSGFHLIWGDETDTYVVNL